MTKIKLKGSLTPPWESFAGEDGPIPDRRLAFEVLGMVDEGSSKRGSTYWKSLYTCPREFAFREVLRFFPLAPSEALTLGWLFHIVMETYYRAVMDHQKTVERPRRPYSAATRLAWEQYWWGGMNNSMQQGMAAVETIMNEPGYTETWKVLERVTGHYFDTNWKTDRWEIMAVEETLEYADDSLDFTARLDLLIRDWVDERGNMRIVEHKTARIITRDLIDNYQMDLQILGQNFLVQNCLDPDAYPPLQGTFVNITTKQVTPRFDRVDASPSQRHIAAFEDSIRSWRRLRAYLEGEGWPKALGKCAGAPRGYTKCDYYDLCHGHPDMTVEDFARSGPPIDFFQKDAAE